MSKLALAAAAALVLAGPALAAAGDNDVPAKEVVAKGVDFNDAAQVRRFYFRLQTAARLVCSSGSAGHLTIASEDLSCIRRNMNEAVRKVDAPRLTAMLVDSYGPNTSASAFAADAR